jgi:hypothetical protein
MCRSVLFSDIRFTPPLLILALSCEVAMAVVSLSMLEGCPFFVSPVLLLAQRFLNFVSTCSVDRGCCF